MSRRTKMGLALIAILVGIGATLAAGPLLRAVSRAESNSPEVIVRWFNDPASRPTLITRRGQKPCPGAPFILPSDGLIGLLYADPAGPYSVFNRHPGIDIFGDGKPGEVPVYAVYDGDLTRLPDWFATVIIRHDDPLQPGRVIWTYYTHMGARDGSRSFVAPQFPPGTSGVFVKQGTLLGYQGEYAGSGPAIGMHVHFSVVQSDSDGSFKNEAVLSNTLDPSPYLGMRVNIDGLPPRPIGCDRAG